MKYQEIEGNLITLAQDGHFNIITHGCNCFCTMSAGIAPQMVKAFRANDTIFHLEDSEYKGDINKLGQIEYRPINISPGRFVWMCNSYTQYHYGHKFGPPFDYDAFTLCMRKINHAFKGTSIGLPQIGAGLAGGDWSKIKQIIQSELKDMDITVVIFKP